MSPILNNVAGALVVGTVVVVLAAGWLEHPAHNTPATRSIPSALAYQDFFTIGVSFGSRVYKIYYSGDGAYRKTAITKRQYCEGNLTDII
jgi:hypothetical protein